MSRSTRRRGPPGPGSDPGLRRGSPRLRRASRWPALLIFLCGAVVGAAALRLAGCSGPGARGPGEERAGTAAPEAPSRAAGEEKPARRHRDRGREGKEPAARLPESSSAPRAAEGEAPRGAAGARIALVIDDLGRSVADLAALERLDVPLTYAVLPFETETPQVVEELRRRGSEILCHLPMEPSGGNDPGPGALWYGMGGEELRRSTAAALAAVPGAVGVNNHMGSRLSADEPSMRTILGLLAERHLFFLDSRTSAQSVGYRLALDLGVPSAERQVFLDDERRQEAIRAQFERLLALARERGEAIAIGHPHPETIEALAAEIPRAREAGYRFVTVSALLDRKPATALARRSGR
jgi:uncharacterized protein